jgi:hypothetical protein
MSYAVRYLDLWRPGDGAAIVNVYLAGTTTPADIFTDEALTVAADNPQVLDEKTINSISYGKWQVPIYTAQSIELVINTGDRSGIIRPPLTTLDGADGADVVVTVDGGTVSRDLSERLADVIHAVDFGELGAVAATNNTTLEAAIGLASGRSGSIVLLPSGTYPFTDLNIPSGVTLMGNGRSATILQCQTADACITIGGDRAGLASLTLDGISLVSGSAGVYSKAKNEVVLNDVEVKRFDTGVHIKGARQCDWRMLFLENCNTGAKLHGDEDAGGGADGDEFRNNRWRGGLVTNCVDVGVDLSFEDKKCWHNEISGVGFESNPAIALNINGARYTRLYGCWWSGCIVNLVVDDDDDTDNEAINSIISLYVIGGSFDTGELTFAGRCQDVEFDRCEFTGATLTLTQPTNAIVARDCIEDADTAIAGTGYRWTRYRAGHHSASSGITADAVATPAWSYELAPGQVGYFRVIAIGNQRDDEKTGEYNFEQSARRPGSELDYDLQTVNWTLGEIITGDTSGATALVVADNDAGGTGTLTLRAIDGEFINNEPLTGDLGGAARAVGTLTGQDAELLGVIVQTKTREDVGGWAAILAVSGPEVRVNVTGAAGDTVEWLVHVDVIVT